MRHFGLQRFTVFLAVGGVRCLHGQFTHTLQHVTHLAQCAFSGLRQRDTVVRIAGSHGQTLGLRIHALGNGKTGRVVLGAVHAQAGRQALHGGAQRTTRQAQVALCIDGDDIGVDGHGHGANSLAECETVCVGLDTSDVSYAAFIGAIDQNFRHFFTNSF